MRKQKFEIKEDARIITENGLQFDLEPKHIGMATDQLDGSVEFIEVDPLIMFTIVENRDFTKKEKQILDYCLGFRSENVKGLIKKIIKEEE